MKKIIPKMVKVFLFFLAGFMLSYYFVGWQDDVLRSPYPLTLQHEEPRSVPGARRNLTLESAYPLDHDELQKYYIDIKTGVRNVARVGDRWIKASDKFYDCAPKIKAKYNTAPEPKTSVHYKGQEGEDQYIYFFDMELGWGGVLIEGETSNYLKLEQNCGKDPRKSVTTVHLAICIEAQFIKMSGTGPMAAAGSQRSPGGTRITTVPCVPMQDVLTMAKLPYVDFYSIDVEGAELAVIHSHDFNSVPAHALLIEMRPADEDVNFANAKIRRALYARGFCRYDNSVGHNNEAWINATWVEPK